MKRREPRIWRHKAFLSIWRENPMLRLAFGLPTRIPRARTFAWSASWRAQPGSTSANPDALSRLQKSPVVQAVLRRMQQRAELQSQVRLHVYTYSSRIHQSSSPGPCGCKHTGEQAAHEAFERARTVADGLGGMGRNTEGEPTILLSSLNTAEESP